MFGALRLGATLILHEGWPTPPSVAATVELNQPSIVLSVPTLFQRLCECGSPSKLAFRAVRCYVSAGERLPPQVGAEWEKASGRPIIDAMSCSELVHKIFANTLSARRAGSSGRPVPGRGGAPDRYGRVRDHTIGPQRPTRSSRAFSLHR